MLFKKLTLMVGAGTYVPLARSLAAILQSLQAIKKWIFKLCQRSARLGHPVDGRLS